MSIRRGQQVASPWLSQELRAAFLGFVVMMSIYSPFGWDNLSVSKRAGGHNA